MESDISKIGSVGQQTGDPREPVVQRKSEVRLLVDSFLLGEPGLFGAN